VRINALDTPYAYRDLVEIVEDAGDRVDLVMLPKVASAADVVFVDTLLTQIEAHKGFTSASRRRSSRRAASSTCARSPARRPGSRR
jgi:citrate lyase beta subunit